MQSRYYDPNISRFLNADSYVTTDITGLLSGNMYAYCENNPVNYADNSGGICIMETDNRCEFVIAKVTKVMRVLYLTLPLLILTIESDFFKAPITDAKVLISALLCVAFLLLGGMRITAKSDGIRVQIWNVTVWHIKLKNIERIEFVRNAFGKDDSALYVIFECYGCPQYSDGNIILLSKYLEIHLLRTYSCVLEKVEEEATKKKLQCCN